MFKVENIRVLEDLILDLLSANLLNDLGQVPTPLKTSVLSSVKQRGWTK